MSPIVSKELVELLDIYLNQGYRTELLAGNEEVHQFLFAKKDGAPFGESYFGQYVPSLLERCCGVKTNFNLLRSSFVTFLYDSEKDEALRESVAQAMRHSTAEARRTYDRRRPEKKKLKGLQYLADLAAAAVGDESLKYRL